MRTVLKYLLLLVFLHVVAFVPSLFADPPGNPPPVPGGGHGGGENQAPAGAPIDGGVGILLMLGIAYGGKKIFRQDGGSEIH